MSRSRTFDLLSSEQDIMLRSGLVPAYPIEKSNTTRAAYGHRCSKAGHTSRRTWNAPNVLRVHKFSIGDSNDHDAETSFPKFGEYREEPKDIERYHLLMSLTPGPQITMMSILSQGDELNNDVQKKRKKGGIRDYTIETLVCEERP